MLALGVGNAWGATASITFSEKGLTNGEQYKDPFDLDDNTTITFAGGDNDGKYYTTGTGIRTYANGTITVECTNGTISEISFTWSGSNKPTDDVATPAGYSTLTDKWTGSASSVTLTRPSGSGHWRLQTVTVTYETSGGGETPDPTTYTIKWHTAKGVTTDVTLNEGAAITQPATDPTMSGYVFMGWTASCDVASDGSDFTALTDFGTADSDKDFYAVFAEATTSGGGAPTETTASVTIQNYASANSWANSTKYASVKIDENITASVTGSSNTGKYYTSGYEWRLYQTETAKLTISTTEGKTIKTAKITYNVSNNGVLKLNSSNVTSGTTSTINASSVTYNVGNSGSATNGQVKVTAIEVVYTSGSAGSTTYSNYITTCSGSAPQPAVLVSIAKTAGKTEFTEGDTFEKATITATYDDATTKDVTSLATFTGYDMNTIGTQTVNVTYEGKSTSYTITVNPKPKYTITWNNAGTTTTTEVVQGEALGTLSEPADCPNGKKFMGWSATDNFASDGSDITYVKKTDVPTGNTTYYAVFAVVEGGNGTPTTATQSIKTYAEANSWTNESKHTEIPVDANITATVTGGSNTGKYYTSGTNWRLYQTENATLTISAVAGYEIQTVKVTYANSNNGVLTLAGSNVTSETASEVNAESVTFGVGNTGSATNGQVRITAIEVTYVPAAKRTDYSPNCDISVEPTWTISKNEIAFADKYVGFEYTETFTINASNLAEDIALAIDGSTFTVSPTSIAKDATFPQTVTVTYAPTAVGTHNATLNITSGSTLSKTIALTGSATEATIYTLTALADINPTDKVIIVGTSGGSTYAMSNDKGASDAPDAVAVTVINNKIATDKTNILWNIAKDGDNLTIYPANQIAKWLYCLADNNDGVRVGTGEAKLFTIDKGYLYTTQTTAARHIGIYNNSDWRCYKPSADAIHTNIKEQSFAFYVLPDTDPSISVNTTSKDFGAVINGKSASQEFEITARNIATPAFSTSVTGANATYFTATINANKVIVTYAPTAVGEHVAALTITETTTSKSVEVALTGECVETVNVATAMALPVDEIAYLSQFEVVYPLKDKSFIYIKDNSGYGLIYDGTLDEQFKAGDRVEGFVGTSSPYKSLPELKAVNKYEDLTITPGVAAEPIEFVTAPTVTDVNKYVVFKNVQFDAAVTFATDAATNTTFTIGSETVTLRNNYKYAASLDANKAYDVYGFVATLQQNEGDQVQVQVYFLTAVEAGGVIETYTVTYDANGATGAAPVDETKYQAGQTFYIENQGELVKEGYEFVGWKYNGTVYEAGKQFTMPTENVTFVAQWEEIVVVPKKDFSEGYWVLVTEASELNADDYIVIAAAEEDLAMKSYESGNNCGQIEITKSANLLIWNENVGVFQLLASGSNYTIQDVNTKDYLYAAGSGSNNYLKANDEVPADATMAQYVWTISFTDGVPTVKATSDNRNTLMYNTGSNLFSCYSSGQKAIALYKYVTELPTIELNSDDNSTVITANAGKTVNVQLNRSFTAGDGYYTLCLPFDIAASEIGTAYTLGAITKHVSGEEGGININLTKVSTIKAGVPYLVLPKTLTNPVFENVIIENTTGSNYTVTGAGVKVTFTGIINGVGEQTNGTTEYYVGNGGYLYNGTVDKLGLRAFFTITDEAGNPTKVRARVVAGENVETGIEDIFSTDAPIKVIENGQLIIIRDGVKYNVQGVRL